MKTMKPGIRVEGGRYYGRRREQGPLEAISPAEAGRPPDVVICRRLADYGPGQMPPTAKTTRCRDCDQPIVFNPAGPHQDRPRICMQCASIQPLPIR